MDGEWVTHPSGGLRAPFGDPSSSYPVSPMPLWYTARVEAANRGALCGRQRAAGFVTIQPPSPTPASAKGAVISQTLMPNHGAGNVQRPQPSKRSGKDKRIKGSAAWVTVR